MVIADLIDLPSLDLTTSQDIGRKYTLYLLGAEPIGAVSPLSYDMNIGFLLDKRTWTLGILPYSEADMRWDERGILMKFSPFSDTPHVHEADPMKLEEIVNGDSTYAVAHCDISWRDSSNSYVHNGRDHFLSPSVFAGKIPRFVVSADFIDDYIL